jgi:hypothetical protein
MDDLSAVEQVVAEEQAAAAAAAEAAREAAAARGDLIDEETPPLSKEEISPEILARLAQEEEETTGSGTIPRARLNEEVEKRRAAEAELATLKSKPVVVEESRIAEELTQTLTQATKELSELRAEQRRLERELELDPDDPATAEQVQQLDAKISDKESALIDIKTEIAIEKREQRVQSQRVAEQAQNSAAQAQKEIYEDYPFLDHTSPLADPALNAKVNALIIGLMAQGKSEAAAIREAADELAPAYGTKNGLSFKGSPLETAADKVRREREAESRKRNSAASVGQPTSFPHRAERGTFALNVNTITAAQLKAMTPEQRAQAMGDA